MPRIKLQTSFFIRILIFILMVSLIPIALLGVYNYSLIADLLEENTYRNQQNEISNLLNQKYIIAEKNAESLELKLRQIKANLEILQSQIELVYSTNMNPPEKELNFIEDSRGFLWQPYKNSLVESNIFVSANSRSRSNLKNEIIKLKEIDTLLKGIFNNSLIAHSIWFCHTSSYVLTYPAYDFKGKIDLGLLPPNLRVQDYEFYFIADKYHNPSREIVWTNPYETFTYYDSPVISASAPIYSKSGRLIGVVGFDIPLENIKLNVQTSYYDNPMPLIFVSDSHNNVIAQNSFGKEIQEIKVGRQVPSKFISEKHIKKIKVSEGNYYYVVSKKLYDPNWTYNILYSEYDLRKTISFTLSKNETKLLTLFFKKLIITVGISSIIIIIISYIFTYRTTKPLISLSEALRDFTKGKFNTISVKNNDEIGKLIESYNFMSFNIQWLLERLKRNSLLINEKNKKLESINEELKLKNRSYEILEETKSDLIMQISHDLKTPLTSIKGTVELLQMYNYSYDEQKKNLKHVSLKIRHILALIDDLNEITQLDSPTVNYNKEFVPVDLLLDYSIELASSQNNSKDISIIKNYDKGLVVEVDPQKINRALFNVLVNSIKYSKDEQSKIIVRAREENIEGEKYIRIDIEDNGIGIEGVNLDKIFDKFYRERRHSESGSGLGMTITKKIIENHGGQIIVKSEIGIGTIVSIILP